jgi:hypothetical protein
MVSLGDPEICVPAAVFSALLNKAQLGAGIGIRF